MSRRKQKKNYINNQYGNNLFFNTLGADNNTGEPVKIDFNQASEKIDNFFNEITFGLNTTEEAIKSSIAPSTKAAFKNVTSSNTLQVSEKNDPKKDDYKTDYSLANETITFEEKTDKKDDCIIVDEKIIDEKTNNSLVSFNDDIVDEKNTVLATDDNSSKDIQESTSENIHTEINNHIEVDTNDTVNDYAEESLDILINDNYCDINLNTPSDSETCKENEIMNLEEVKANTDCEESDIDKSKIYARFDESNDFFEKNNDTLLISEREKKVFLPYSMNDINQYLVAFSDKYSNAREVIENEFIVPLNYFTDYSYAARFREAYALYRDREGKSAVESFIFAFKTMKIGNLQPAIIAACRNERVFNDYLMHLRRDDLDNFSYFKIEYQITPSIK